MKIKFLGTGSGKTSLNHYHSSFLISSSNHSLLVDCGDGISKAILTQNIDFNSIDSILISHFHADHFSGLASLITQMKLLSRKKDLIIFIHSSEKKFLEDFIFHSYLFKERMTFHLKIIAFFEEREITVNDNFYFISKINSHLNKYKQYDSNNRLGFVSLSFYFKDDTNSLIYSGDIGSEKDLFLFNQKVDWFISEITHINPSSLINVLQDLDPNKIILTHIDDEMEPIINAFIVEVLSLEEKSRFVVAFDGLEISQFSSGCL
jgi:ribonuclease Z